MQKQRSAVFFFCLMGVLAMVTGSEAAAQTVRGSVIDQFSRPVGGAIVIFLDSTTRIVGRAITGEAGAFEFSREPGKYRLRVLRIGYRPVTTRTFALAAGQVLTLPAITIGALVSLDTVFVTAASSCRADADAGQAFMVWEQARTAIQATIAAAASASLDATLMTYEQDLDPTSGRVLKESSDIRTGSVPQPWKSLSGDSLSTLGYVVTHPDNWTYYYGPSLDHLVSDQFVRDHCLRVVPTTDTTKIVIAFEPTTKRGRRSDILGTIRLDRATLELRRLEFRYTNLPEAETRAGVGGELEFARMGNGGWLVSRWQIRIPVAETVYERASGFSTRATVPRRSVVLVRTSGGSVALLKVGTDTLWAGSTIHLAGTVRDSARKTAISDAVVSMRGTGIETTTDSSGRFRLSGLRPGIYTLDIRTRDLSPLGALYSVPATASDSGSELTVWVPPVADVARSRCGSVDGGIIAGLVSANGVIPDSARVVVEWSVWPESTESASPERAEARRQWLESHTGVNGRYRVCGLPTKRMVSVQARSATGVSQTHRIALSDQDPFAALDLAIEPDTNGKAELSGLILSDIDGAPIPDAEVAIASLSRSTFTNAAGSFRLADIPPGRHSFSVRRIGWQPRILDIALRQNQVMEQRILLSRVRVLDTVSVTETFWNREFEENRRIGLGQFLTRSDLESLNGLALGSAIEQFRGLRILRLPGPANRSYVVSSRGARSITASCRGLEGGGSQCACFARVYLDGVLLNHGDRSELIPDINRIPITSIEAIEYYSGPASTPLRYSGLNSACGALVIHTARFRKDAQPQADSVPPY